MATRKTNQIDLNVGQIQDPVVREAFLLLGEALNIIVGVGVSTDGTVTAQKGFSTGDAPFKAKIFKGRLGPSGAASAPWDHAMLILPRGGLIVSAQGYAQFEGSDEWRVMGTDAATDPAVDTVRFSLSGGLVDRVGVENSDATNANNYKVIIFYTEAEQL